MKIKYNPERNRLTGKKANEEINKKKVMTKGKREIKTDSLKQSFSIEIIKLTVPPRPVNIVLTLRVTL